MSRQKSFKEINEKSRLRPRKIPVQNVVLRLRNRETHFQKPVTDYHMSRAFHQNVFPNFTVVNVEKPPCFLRKFSPDGHFFVAFSSDQTSIEIYEYQGPAAAEKLLKNCKGEYTSNRNDRESINIRTKIFETFFKLRHIVNVASEGEQLNRECSLFTDDGRYVIIGSASYVPEEPHPLFYNIYRNNESVSPNPRSPLEDYSLHIVDLIDGFHCDTREFKIDKIFLSHNQGLYLYKNTLAVLSVQHQTIHIFQISPLGLFIDVRSIGRFCYEDDALVLAPLLNSSSATCRPFREATINSLKHRLLVYLYRRSVYETLEDDGGFTTGKFFKSFDHFKKLKMWKMQLLDENHLLIKYASEDIVTLRVSDPNSNPSFFVVYNMVSVAFIYFFFSLFD